MLFPLKVFFYKLLSRVLQYIYTALYGPTPSQLSQHGLLSYEVVYDWKSFDYTQPAPELFTLKFREVKGLEYLERDDVTLYTVSCTRFVFVRTPPDVDIHNVDRYPFAFVSKHDNAVEVLTVSRELACQYLASTGKLDRDCSNTTILYNIGRCGSTLLAAMMNKTQQYQVMSEPWVVSDLLTMIHKNTKILISKADPAKRTDATEDPEFTELIKAVFVLLTPDQNKRYFIKAQCPAMYLFVLLNQVLPGMKECFLYRDLKPQVTSFVKTFGSDPFKVTTLVIEDILGLSQLPEYLQEIWKQNRVATWEHVIMYITLANIHIYQTETNHRESERRPRVKCYSYESLIEDRTSFCRSFFTDIGLDHVYIPTALVAMEKDSQANSGLAKKNTIKSRGVSRSDVWEWGVKMGRVLGVKVEGKQCRVANMGDRPG